MDNIEEKEKFLSENLEKFYLKNSGYINRQIEILIAEWAAIEDKYVTRLEKYMGVKVDFEATCYLTTLGIAPYNIKQNYFICYNSNDAF